MTHTSLVNCCDSVMFPSADTIALDIACTIPGPSLQESVNSQCVFSVAMIALPVFESYRQHISAPHKTPLCGWHHLSRLRVITLAAMDYYLMTTDSNDSQVRNRPGRDRSSASKNSKTEPVVRRELAAILSRRPGQGSPAHLSPVTY